MSKWNISILISVLTVAMQAQAVQAADTATLPNQDGPEGPVSEILYNSDQQEVGTAMAPLAEGRRDGTILWHRHLDDPIYTSCGISENADMAFSGNRLNSPKQVEAVPLIGDGTPDWTHSGTEFYVDASRLGGIFAAVDIDTSDSTAVISAWMPGSSTPLWSHSVSPCRSMTYQGWATRKPIQVSDDGSSVVVALVMYTETGEQRGHLYAYDSADGSSLADWEFPTGNVVATVLSADGRFVAMAGWPNLYVYDLDEGALRWSGAIGSGNDALAISANGEYLAWGWTTFNLRRWNGSSYGYHWSHTPGTGIYLGQCAFSPDDAFAVAWDNGNNMVNEISVELYTLSTIEQIWHYDYQGTPASTHVDIPTSMVFSPDANRLAVGSWGGSFPEIHVFDTDGPDPVYTLDTPGSIFDIDIVCVPGGGHYVSACGKGVHAGTGGRGGDFYAIEIPGDETDLEAEFADVAIAAAYPNPFNPSTTIRFTLPEASTVTLTVYDLAGRRVCDLHREDELGQGDHEVQWHGTDVQGNPVPSGIYLYRLEAGGLVQTRKVTLLK